MTVFKSTITTLSALALAGMTTLAAPGTAHADTHSTPPDPGVMHVTKSPTCGCCGAWVALARQEGFEVEVTDTRDIMTIKRAVGLPGALSSCHTAQIDGYVIEGHVPFAAIDKLLSERPAIKGIAVPGMPAGSPGMGDDPAARFDVIAFGGEAGTGEVFYRAGR